MTDVDSPAAVLMERWSNVLRAGSGLFNLVDVTHPLRLYVGGNKSGQPTLTIVTAVRPPQLAQFESLEIEQRVRDDGTWLLLLQLQAADAFSEFVAMCVELIGRSASGGSEPEALKLLLEGLDHWRTLFKPVRDRLLSEERQRGLMAELICMQRFLRPSRSWTEVIQAWKGPLGAEQDFQLAGGGCLEVKSVHASSSSVRISSLEQLEVFGRDLGLLTILVERDVASSPGVLSLPDVYRSVERDLNGEFDLLDDFRGKAQEVGFFPEQAGYDDFHFRVGQMTLYDVSSTFPRLVRADVASDVIRVEYDLALSGLSQFITNDSAIVLGPPSQMGL